MLPSQRTHRIIVTVLSGTARRGLPAICVDARHAKAALDMAANRTDANDADVRGSGQLSNVSLLTPDLMRTGQMLLQAPEVAHH